MQRSKVLLGVSTLLISIMISCLIASKITSDPSNLLNKQNNLTPSVTLIDSPFSSQNILQDSEFNQNSTWWNYSDGVNTSARWNSIQNSGQFNYSSGGVGGDTPVGISTAYYATKNIKPKIVTQDLSTLEVIQESPTRNIFDITFLSSLTNGDKIILYFTSGLACNVTIRNPSSQSAPSYGFGEYTGGSQTLTIVLTEISGSQTTFNLDIVFAMDGWNAFIDLVKGAKSGALKFFNSTASIYQPLRGELALNYSYVLNYSLAMNSFSNVQSALFYVRVNNTLIREHRFVANTSIQLFQIVIPRSIFKSQGMLMLNFSMNVLINSTNSVDINLTLDSAYIHQGPVRNLLDNSDFERADYWNGTTPDSQYALSHSSTLQNFKLRSVLDPLTTNGTMQILQIFNKNTTKTGFQFAMDYKMENMTGIKDINLSIYINNTQILNNKTFISTNTAYSPLRVNITAPLVADGDYLLNLTFAVHIQPSAPKYNLTAFLDNLYLYPIWATNLTQIGSYNENVTAGTYSEIQYNYNTTITGDNITTATILVYNFNTGDLWTAFTVINLENGSYIIQLRTTGYSLGNYNISIVFWAPNFNESMRVLKFNIGGGVANLTVIDGALYNSALDIWIVNYDNTPYYNDQTRKITVYLKDNATNQPLENAYIESYLGTNLLAFQEPFKITNNPDDRGKYVVTLDSSNIAVISSYYLLNFTIRASVSGYASDIVLLTTLIRPCPTSIDVSNIPTVYQDSTINVMCFYKDIFHNTGIESGDVTWDLVNTTYFGQIPFIFSGVYSGSVQLTGLKAGEYIFRVNATKSNYASFSQEIEITILAKYNITLEPPVIGDLIEGNTYIFTSYIRNRETGQPLVNKNINVHTTGTLHETDMIHNLITDKDGKFELLLVIPLGERTVNVNAYFAGEYNLAGFNGTITLSVNPKSAMNLTLISQSFGEELVEGESIEVIVLLSYQNGTSVANQPVIVKIGNSYATAITSANGTANVFVLLTEPGTFPIELIYEGSNYFNASSYVTSLTINVMSTEEYTAQQNQRLYLMLGTSLAGAGLVSYMIYRFRIVPKQRKKQQELLELMGKYDDTNNIQQILLVNLQTGLETLSINVGAIPLSSTLLSGFLQAITSFGESLVSLENATTQSDIHEQEMAFQKFRILIRDSPHFRAALILLRPASNRLRRNITSFVQSVENRFRTMLDDIGNRMIPDAQIEDLIESHFALSLNYTHIINFSKNKTDKKANWEEKIIECFNQPPFLGLAHMDVIIDKMITENPGHEHDIYHAAENLRYKNMLLPMSPQTKEIMKTFERRAKDFPVALDILLDKISEHKGNLQKIREDLHLDQNAFHEMMQILHDFTIVNNDMKLTSLGHALKSSIMNQKAIEKYVQEKALKAMQPDEEK